MAPGRSYTHLCHKSHGKAGKEVSVIECALAYFVNVYRHLHTAVTNSAKPQKYKEIEKEQKVLHCLPEASQQACGRRIWNPTSEYTVCPQSTHSPTFPDFSDVFPFKNKSTHPISVKQRDDHRRMHHANILKLLWKILLNDDCNLFSTAPFHCTF